MQILILNGNPDGNRSGFETILHALRDALSGKGHTVEMMNLREMDIGQCTGCLGCWLRTPGVCHLQDDAEAMCRAYINADFVLLASPLSLGFVSAELKAAQDRLVPIILPYFEFDHGEMHHAPRYPNYPKLGLLIEEEDDTDAEDIELIVNIYERFARNVKTQLCLFQSTQTPVTELTDAIDHF